ncbi:hypothetical protein ACVR1I_02490 [Streptococcus cameli]
MKKFAHLLKDQLNLFLGNAAPPIQIEEEDNPYGPLVEMIAHAQKTSSAVHVIYSKQKSITGEIVKWDEKREQLIVKNFAKNLTTIIRLKDIQRITLVPETITRSQKLD